MSPHHQSSRSWIVTALLGAAVLAYVFFVFRPGQKALAEMQALLSSHESSIMATTPLETRLEDLDRQAAEVRSHVEEWRDGAPQLTNLAKFYGKITSLTASSETALVRFAPEPPVKLNRVGRVTLEMACEGQFGQIARFLQGLEQLKATVWLDRMQIRPLGENGEKLHCEITLTIFTDNPGNSE